MDYKEIIKKIEPELDKTFNFLEREMAKIRTGAASPSLVEDITVDNMGTKLPLKQLGAISASGPRRLVVQPWDKSCLEAIERAISQTGMGLSCVVEKEVIRISIPSLTEEYRQSMLRLLSEKTEEAKKTIRRWREEAWKQIQDGFKAGAVREDDKFRGKDELQKIVDKYNEKIEEIKERKKKEIEL